MKPNKFQITLVIYLKSSQTKRVDWVEDSLMRKVVEDGKTITEPLTLEDAETFFQAKFKEWKDEGVTIIRKNVKGENSIIPFAEIEYATFSITEIKDKKEDKEITDITQHPAHPNRYRKEDN